MTTKIIKVRPPKEANMGRFATAQQTNALLAKYVTLRNDCARKLVQFMDEMPPASLGAPDLCQEQMNKLVHDLRP